MSFSDVIILERLFYLTVLPCNISNVNLMCLLIYHSSLHQSALNLSVTGTIVRKIESIRL